MKLSNHQLSVLAARGSFLPERLQDVVCFNHSAFDESDCRQRYDLWKSKSGVGHREELFLKRLALEGITRERALEAMAEPAWDPQRPFPEWVADLQAICELFPFNRDERQSRLFGEAQAGVMSQNDMTAALQPFVYFAGRRLEERMGAPGRYFAESAWADLGAGLARDLGQLCFRTFSARFQMFLSARHPLGSYLGSAIPRDERDHYWQEYIDECLVSGWPELLLEYPVLGRLMTVVINQWVDHIAELARFLAADLRQLETRFFDGSALGAVVGVQSSLSDPHNKGKSVYILEFSGNRRIVFKPRSLKIDKVWGELLDWVNQKSVPTPLVIPAVLDGEDHGWIEYIHNESLPDEEAAWRFYFRAGVIIGMVYALGGNDFHRENLMAWGEYPVLIDTEMLLQPRVKPFKPFSGEVNAQQKAVDFLSNSVLRTGFFPSWATGVPGEPPADSGSLTGRADGCGNLPRLNGSSLSATDWRKPLLAGFRWIYCCLIRHRSELLEPGSPLEQFSTCKFRFIIRSSQTCGEMLRHTAKPEFLKDGLLYSLELERLAAAYLHSAPEEILKDLWPIFQSEREALHCRDYPIFYGRADALGLMDAACVLNKGYFIQSAMDRAKELIGRLDQDDLRIQLDLFENALEIYTTEAHDEGVVGGGWPALEPNGGINDPRLLEEAWRIYEQMLAQRVIGPGGDATWIVQQYDLISRKLSLGRIAFPLYDGVLGLALFMGALYRLTGERSVKDHALQCVQPFQDRPGAFPIHRGPLGLSNGLAGLATVMMGLAEYLEEPSLEEYIRGLLHRFPLDRLEADRQYDVMGGLAGLVLALVKFSSLTEDGPILELARHGGQRILSGRMKIESSHRVWRSWSVDAPPSGMAHGAAGIAGALLKLAELTGEPEYYEAALEAMDYEMMRFDSVKTGSPATGVKGLAGSWCSGVPGIGLAGVANRHLISSSAVIAAIEEAITFTLDYPMHGSDHFCCGNSGRIDFLIEAGLKLERPALLEEARQRIGWMVSRKEQKGKYTLNVDQTKVFNPSFFQGTAGIGYEMLRCVAPQRIFSIL